MNPKISIITVVYNAASALEVTLRAISDLNYDNKEVIVIDGGSSDGTADVISSYADIINYTTSEPDDGLYDAMNKAIKVATGEYLWFVNAGDLPYDDDVLRRVFLPTEQYSDIYYGEAIIVDKNGKGLGLRKKKTPNRLNQHSFIKGMVVCHQSFIVRKDIAPLYDLNYKYVADIDWAIKCIDKAKSIKNSKTIICKFQEGGISTAHKKESLIERWKVMRKRYGLLPTTFSHLCFAFDSLFKSKYRSV